MNLGTLDGLRQSPPATPLATVMLAARPAGLWIMNGTGTSQTDSSGNGRTMTTGSFVGPAFGTSGLGSHPMYATEHGVITTPAWFESLSEFGAECWFTEPAGGGTTQSGAPREYALITCDNEGLGTTSSGRMFSLSVSTGLVPYANLYFSNTSSWVSVNAAAIGSAGAWHHAFMSASVSRGLLTLVVDGVPTQVSFPNTNAVNTGVGQDLLFGTSSYPGGGFTDTLAPAQACLSHCAVYTYAPGIDLARRHYAAGKKFLL